MKRALIALLLVLTAPASWAYNLWGVDINGLELQSSIWSIRNAVTGTAPDPVVNTLGVSIPFRFLGNWTFRPEAQVFYQGYAFANGRAVPESAEWDNVTILGVMIHPTGGFEYDLTPTLSWSAEAGLGFLARFPLYLNGSKAGDWALPVTGWLLAGRLFYPSLGTGITWQFSPVFAFTVRGQAFFPIFNLWNNLPLDDEFTYGVGVGVRFTF